jgi:hypothetical protein
MKKKKKILKDNMCKGLAMRKAGLNKRSSTKNPHPLRK